MGNEADMPSCLNFAESHFKQANWADVGYPMTISPCAYCYFLRIFPR